MDFDMSQLNTRDTEYLIKCFFDMIQEQKTISKKIYETKNNLLEEKQKETEHEAKLWLETDFKEKQCTNKELREAYVKQQMKDYISKRGKLQNEVKKLEREYEISTHIIVILIALLDQVIIDE